MNETYYTSRKSQHMKTFDMASGWYRPQPVEKCVDVSANLVCLAAKQEYESLIP